MTEKIKLYCIVAKDAIDQMKGIRGKMLTQGGHAYVHAYWDSQDRFPEHARAYRDSGLAFKITAVVQTVEELLKFEAAYRDVCGVSLVTDAGRTVFKNEDGSPRPTTTCLGIGPIPESLIGDDLADLKTFT